MSENKILTQCFDREELSDKKRPDTVSQPSRGFSLQLNIFPTAKQAVLCFPSPPWSGRSDGDSPRPPTRPGMPCTHRTVTGPSVQSVLGCRSDHHPVLLSSLHPFSVRVCLPLQAATQFKTSLAKLMEILMSKEPSYVRCIKPNDSKQAGTKLCGCFVFKMRVLCGADTRIRL